MALVAFDGGAPLAEGWQFPLLLTFHPDNFHDAADIANLLNAQEPDLFRVIPYPSAEVAAALRMQPLGQEAVRAKEQNLAITNAVAAPLSATFVGRQMPTLFVAFSRFKDNADFEEWNGMRFVELNTEGPHEVYRIGMPFLAQLVNNSRCEEVLQRRWPVPLHQSDSRHAVAGSGRVVLGDQQQEEVSPYRNSCYYRLFAPEKRAGLGELFNLARDDVVLDQIGCWLGLQALRRMRVGGGPAQEVDFFVADAVTLEPASGYQQAARVAKIPCVGQSYLLSLWARIASTTAEMKELGYWRRLYYGGRGDFVFDGGEDLPGALPDVLDQDGILVAAADHEGPVKENRALAAYLAQLAQPDLRRGGGFVCAAKKPVLPKGPELAWFEEYSLDRSTSSILKNFDLLQPTKPVLYDTARFQLPEVLYRGAADLQDRDSLYEQDPRDLNQHTLKPFQGLAVLSDRDSLGPGELERQGGTATRYCLGIVLSNQRRETGGWCVVYSRGRRGVE